MKIQNQLFWKFKDQIEKELSTDAIKQLLAYNGQIVRRAGRDDLVTILADCMCFGALEKCPTCKDGQLVYRYLSLIQRYDYSYSI